MELTDPGQQLCPGHLRHLLASQHDPDQAPVVAELGEQAERIVGRVSTDDLIVRPVPLAELSLDNTSRPRIVIDYQQHWSRTHRRHLRSRRSFGL
jgi:hypothetical protein